jgi:hypothetical protein
MGRECNMHGIAKKFIRNFVRKPVEKTPLGRSRHI